MSNRSKFYRKQRFYSKFFVTCVALTSLWGGIISFSPISLNYLEFIVSLLIIIVISFIVGVITIPKKIGNIADPDLPKKCRIQFPCEYEHYKEANKIADKMFPDKKDSPSFRKVKAWRRKNKFILSLYYDENNKVKGYFDVLPLKKEFEKNSEKVYLLQNYLLIMIVFCHQRKCTILT